MIIGGEKWACDACVRGHRVSNCQHSSRNLQHVNKKGRPVTQCAHCRTLRKSRSAHIKCDCGERGHNKGQCSHLERADSKDADICCCSHGGRCSCALKKDHLDPVPEADPSADSSPLSLELPRKPRLASTQSEGTLTVFSNGHHKPVHKHNQMAHISGAPYRIPRAHQIHGNSEHARRSVDSLPATNSARPKSQIQESIASAQQETRLVKSAHSSPQLRTASNFEHANCLLPPLDFSFSDQTPAQFDNSGVSSFGKYSIVGSPVTDAQLFSAGPAAPFEDWFAHNVSYESNDISSSFSQPPSYTAFDLTLGQTDLYQLSSSEVSEIDDLISYGGNPSPINPPSLVHHYDDSSEACETDDYRLSSSSSYMAIPQVTTPAFRHNGPLDVSGSLKQDSVDQPAAFESAGDLNDESSNRDFLIGGFTFDDYSKTSYSQPTDLTDLGLSMPLSTDGPDTIWISRMSSGDSLDSEIDFSESFWG
ncbi:MAG: hypothetical protein M1829_002831 [Trizodia sp. TS-e1964]|nr:MAG: hypothetical protein M1829_002831 [Trizodia sp. TS-e1964]